jgi:organic radical activating enzyme
MNPMSKSKSCPLKAQQKTFYLLQNRIASCCRAQADTLSDTDTLDFYLEKWQQEKILLDQGVEIPGCEVCWQHENQGQLSYRLTNPEFNSIELYLSNLCNQMCSYCSPKFSSTWQDNLEEHGMFVNISSSAKQNLQIHQQSANIEHWVDQISNYLKGQPAGSVFVKLMGGEPLMQQRNLDKLLTLNLDSVNKLVVHTNLNPPTNKFLLWLLQNISADKLLFTISIDSSPGFNQWPRAKFDQFQFENNLAELKKYKVSTVISAVISVLSVFDLSNFVPWAQDQKIHITFSKLYHPDCLDPVLIPEEFRQKIWTQIEKFNPPVLVKEVLQTPAIADRIRLIEQYNYLRQYFERNNLDPWQYDNVLFKQYWTWLTRHYKT